MIASAHIVAAIIFVAALWLAIAAALSLLAARRIRRAQAVVGAARQMRGLLEAAPACPLIRVPASPTRLGNYLGNGAYDYRGRSSFLNVTRSFK